MLIYQIPSDIYDNIEPIPEFTKAFIDAEKTSPLVDSCLFEIINAKDSRQHLQAVEYIYLIIPDYYQEYFQPLLSKYGAMKLDSLPSFNKIARIWGDESAIDKIER